MRRTFRLKLFALVAAAALGLLVLLISSSIVEQRVEAHLAEIRVQYIPKIGLRERLQAKFEDVSRQLRDAAEASEIEMLDLMALKPSLKTCCASSTNACGVRP